MTRSQLFKSESDFAWRRFYNRYRIRIMSGFNWNHSNP